MLPIFISNFYLFPDIVEWRGFAAAHLGAGRTAGSSASRHQPGRQYGQAWNFIQVLLVECI